MVIKLVTVAVTGPMRLATPGLVLNNWFMSHKGFALIYLEYQVFKKLINAQYIIWNIRSLSKILSPKADALFP